jgi:hypothetical protein
MYPNKMDKRKGEAVGRFQGLSPQESQEGNTRPGISCCFRRLGRKTMSKTDKPDNRLLFRKAPTRILPTSFSPSRVYLPAQSNPKIIKEDIQEDRRAAKELVSLKKGLRGSYQPMRLPRHHRPAFLPKINAFSNQDVSGPTPSADTLHPQTLSAIEASRGSGRARR